MLKYSTFLLLKQEVLVEGEGQ